MFLYGLITYVWRLIMKLKFRADHKDIVAFLWACLLLLIVVSLCVVNLYHTGEISDIPNTQGFKWTFNFIKGFFPPYLGYTLVFWVLSVVLLTASVSSHFFTREKGFGIVEGKKEEKSVGVCLETYGTKGWFSFLFVLKIDKFENIWYNV